MLHRSTYWLLTPDEVSDKDWSDAQEEFMARVYERFGSQVVLIGLENTLQYDLYEGETQNKQTFPQLAEELDPMLAVGDL